MFINSLIFNSEAWYNVTNSDFDELEKADEALLRKILECPAGTPKEMLYLELGCLPKIYHYGKEDHVSSIYPEAR